jgi:hypothetical protein
MYLNLYYQRPADEWEAGTLHVFDDDNGYKKLPVSRYAYKLNPNGEFRTLYGQPCKKVKRWSKKDNEEGLIFEGDVPPEMRYIVDNYTDSDIPSKHHVEFFFDIEVDATDGLPDIEAADNVITAISYYTKVNKEYVALLLDPDNEMESYSETNDKGEKIVVRVYENEELLLNDFISDYLKFVLLYSLVGTLITSIYLTCIIDYERFLETLPLSR